LPDLTRWHRISVQNDKADMHAAAAAIRLMSGVVWANLEGQGLPPGGSPDITVAVIDSGVDYLHIDLASNMWVNVAEIPGNSIDEALFVMIRDGDGCILLQESNTSDNPAHNSYWFLFIGNTG